ncbi:ABC1 kinase family protein [Persicimonas caeni]|uniref:ABC1 kinase family protein n=1 Tax=Persicimonas caeni TaxID=2292766 RepID=UPI00143D583F|nr:AarF/UbiB family protein [Persicimonas caeni]
MLAGTSFTVLFTMVAIVALELLSHGRSAPGVPRLPGLPHPLRSLRRRLTVASRFTEVTRLLVRHGLGDYVGLGRGAGAKPPPEALRWVREFLEEAGGMFVKLGQLLSTRVDLIPPSAAREFTRLQEHASPADPDAVRQLLEAELGRPVDEVFSEFDWEPLASASLGQVHAARLPTGEEVAVKVQRPGIAAAVDRDLAIISRLAETIETHTEWGRDFGVSEIADEFAARLREELDYRLEASRAIKVAAALESTPKIHVHRVWEELSTAKVLVMERLAGTSVGKLAPGEAVQDADMAARRQLADALLSAELELMLSGERFHADPHPGNVFVLDDGRLGLLDFGAAGRLDAFERASIAAMLGALRSGDPALLRQAIFEVADVRADVDTSSFDRALARFMAEYMSSDATPGGAALGELVSIFAAHGLRLPSTTTTMFRALVTLEGTLNMLAPGYEVVAAAERVGHRMVREAVLSGSLKDVLEDEVLQLIPLLRRMPRHLDRLATLAEQGELRARVSLLSDREDVAVVSRLVNRGVLALTGCSLGVASALLLGIDAGPAVTARISLIELLGGFGLAAGAVLVLRVVLAALREGQSSTHGSRT